MELKAQDLLVLLKVAAHPPQRWTYACSVGRSPVTQRLGGSPERDLAATLMEVEPMRFESGVEGAGRASR